MKNIIVLAGLFLITLSQAATVHAATLRVFTDRPKDRLEKAFSGFTAVTGSEIELTVAPYPELLAKIQAGEPADVLLLKDLGSLTEAVEQNVFTPMDAANRAADVAPFMREAGGLWTALSYRVRTAAYDPSVGSQKALTGYRALAGPAFVGQLCLRNAKDYMSGLVAWLVARDGEAKTEALLKAWKNNLAANFTDSDTSSLKNIESGVCTATITNHYYLARLINADARFPVNLAFLEQNNGGVHTNGFGGGLVAGSKDLAGGNRLLAYLLSEPGQNAIVEAPSYEYPALRRAQPEQLVRNFGGFNASEIAWTAVGANYKTATEILERVGWAK